MLILLTNFKKNYPEISGKCEKVHDMLALFLSKNLLISKNKKNLLLAARIYLIGMTRIPLDIRKKIERGEVLNQQEEIIFQEYPNHNLDIIKQYYRDEYNNEVFLSALQSHKERFDGRGFKNKISKYSNYQTTYILSMFDKFYDNYQINHDIDQALNLIDKDNGCIDPYWIDILKENFKNKSFREEIKKILNS